MDDKDGPMRVFASSSAQSSTHSDREQIEAEDIVAKVFTSAAAVLAAREQWEFRYSDRVNPEGISDEKLQKEQRQYEAQFRNSLKAALKNPLARALLPEDRSIENLAMMPDPLMQRLLEDPGAKLGSGAERTQSSEPPTAAAGTPPHRSPSVDPRGNQPIPADVSQPATEPLRAVLAALERASAQVEFMNPSLGSTVRQLQRQAAEPGQTEQVGFRTRVAYALQDVEKVAGTIAVEPALREELARLATTMSGLRNERMQELLKATPGIADPKLSSDIRTTAADIARQTPQDTPDIASRLDALDNRLRLAPRMPGAEAARAAGSETPRLVVEGSARASAVDPATGPRAAPRAPAVERRDDPQGPPPSQIVVPSAGANALLNILAALRPHAPSGPRPWDGPQDSLADRHRRFEQTVMAGRREDAALGGAERAGRAALEALQGLGEGPRAGVFGKIQDAAKTAPGGMATVLAEMRDGGRYAELREQFNAALSTEKGFGAAYDRATAALAQYGEQRTAIVPILARRSEMGAVAAKFDRLDAEIGQAASALPGRKDGRTALEELGEKAVEVVSKALDAVKSAFTAGPAARNGLAVGPSMTP